MTISQCIVYYLFNFTRCKNFHYEINGNYLKQFHFVAALWLFMQIISIMIYRQYKGIETELPWRTRGLYTKIIFTPSYTKIKQLLKNYRLQ